MNIPLKLPKVTNSSSSNMQQFLLMLLATTISIVLTFGTSAFLDKRKKEAEKKEMVMMIISTEFSETTENIFSSNIETFNTLGNVNFVHEVSSFYNMRHLYHNVVIDSYKQELSTYGVRSVESLFQIDFPEHYFTGKSFLRGMKVIRNRCMQMIEEMREAEEIISRARERSFR